MVSLLLGLMLAGFVGTTPLKESPQDVRIVGGENINITEAPYQVSVLYRGRHSCGGAIVSKDIIITAAHCIVGTFDTFLKCDLDAFEKEWWYTARDRWKELGETFAQQWDTIRANPKDFQVRAGSSSNSEGGQIIPVGDMIWHPDFTYTEMDSDIAVIWLSYPLEFNDAVKLVKMVDAGEEIADGSLTTVTGWGNIAEAGGYPQTLQKVLIPKVSEQVCDAAYSAIYSISPRMLCAGVPEGGKDACQGDSGGPLVYDYKLTGVVSWGLGCARPDYPGVYAKVSALRTWVDDNISFMRLKNIVRYLRP